MLPRAFIRAPDKEEALMEVSDARKTSMAERARILEALCRMAAEQTAQHPEPQRVLDWQDPLSPETEALLARLRERYRKHG